ncbi:MAG: hypothetical protein ABSH20_06780 [Tepidisphaeraceae bacterium]|jgi:hypothetical protein
MRWVIAMGFALAVAGGDSAELRENPAYRAWASFKPGTTVVSSTVTTQGEARQADVETTSRLLEVHADRVVIENSGSMEAGDSRVKLPSEREEIPAKIAAGKLPPGRVAEEAGESIEIGGRSLRVHRTRWVQEQGAASTETTRWSSDQLPGGIAREVVVVRGKQTTVTRTDLLRWEPAH